MTFSAVFCLVLAGLSAEPSDESLVGPSGATKRVDIAGHRIFDLQWREPTVRRGFFRTVTESFGRPAISQNAGGLAIVGTATGDVLAMSLRDGQEVWRYAHGVPFETTATILRQGSVEVAALLGARDGSLIALNLEDGSLQWQVSLEGEMRAEPREVDTTLIVTNSQNKVAALEAATGSILWTQGRPPSAGLTIEGTARAVVENEQVFTTFSDGYVASFDLHHGTLIWSRPLSLRGGGFVDADADPFIADGRLYVASYSDGVYALNLRDGQTLWNRFTPAVTSLTYTENNIVVAANAEGFLWGFEPGHGRCIYRTKVSTGPVSRIVTRDNLLVLTAGVSGLVVLNATNGEPLQATALGGRVIGDPVWVRDELAFLSSSGYVFAWKYIHPEARNRGGFFHAEAYDSRSDRRHHGQSPLSHYPAQ